MKQKIMNKKVFLALIFGIALLGFFVYNVRADTVIWEQDAEDGSNCFGWSECEFAFDENWNSYAEQQWGGTENGTYIEEYFTKPVNVNGANWTFKISTWAEGGGDLSEVHVFCYNGDDWTFLGVKSGWGATFTLNISSQCWSQATLKIRTMAIFDGDFSSCSIYYYEGKVKWVATTGGGDIISQQEIILLAGMEQEVS